MGDYYFVGTCELGLGVGRLISSDPRSNFNPGFSISLFKRPFGVIFPILLGAFNHQIVEKWDLPKFSSKPYRSEIKFHNNPGLS